MTTPQVNPDWATLPLFNRQNWTRVRFGDFAESIRESVQPTPEDSAMYVGLEHMDSGSLHVRRWGSQTDLKGQKLRMQVGDILFAKRNAYLRRVAVAPHEGLFSAHGMVLRAKPEVILTSFLPFLMMSDKFMDCAERISVGSLSPTINWSTLKLQEFDLPPMDQQWRIADLLWEVDQVLVNTVATQDAAQVLVDAEINDFLYGKTKWPLLNSKDVLAEGPRNGFSPPTTSDTGRTPTLSISAVRGNKVVPQGSLKYVDISPDAVTQFRLRQNDILVVRGNGNRLLCGRAGIVDEFPENCFYPDLLIRLRFRPDALLPEFAVLQWNETKTHSRLLKKAKSSNGISKINGQDIQSHQLLVPPIAEQKRFLEELNLKTAAMKAMAKAATETANLQRELVNALF